VLDRIIKTKMRSFLVLALSLILLGISLISAKRIGFEFMPMLDEGDIALEVELPVGMNLAETLKKCGEIEKQLYAFTQVKHVLVESGKVSALDRGVNLARISVKLIEADQRRENSQEMANVFTQALSGVTDVKLRISAVSSVGQGEAPIQFYLRGPRDEKLEEIRAEIVGLLQNLPDLDNFTNSSKPGQPEVVIRPDRRKLTEAGLTAYDLALTARSAVEGLKTSQYEENGENHDIRLMLTGASVDTPEKIAALGVVNPATFHVYRLGDLAQVTLEKSQSKILHKDKVKAIEFSGHPAMGVPLGTVVNQMQAKLDELRLPEGYRIEWSGSFEIMNEAVRDMGFTFLLALVLTYMLLAAILESLTQPLMILGTVPLAMIGVFWAMDLTALTMNIMSMMAIVMLVGIVVNNAILLLEYTNLLRQQRGLSVTEALLEACPARLQPILMSTIAIMLGMLPMAMGIGEAGREFRQPMGVVSIGGLVISGVLTLIVIPAVYNLFTGRQKMETEIE
jgi:HAE1 family hydrophobic/amphiphilic exporter-1